MLPCSLKTAMQTHAASARASPFSLPSSTAITAGLHARAHVVCFTNSSLVHWTSSCPLVRSLQAAWSDLSPACVLLLPPSRGRHGSPSCHAPAIVPLSPCKVMHSPTFNLSLPRHALPDSFGCSFFSRARMLPRRQDTTLKLAIKGKRREEFRVGYQREGRGELAIVRKQGRKKRLRLATEE